jgi:hypothetical protein
LSPRWAPWPHETARVPVARWKVLRSSELELQVCALLFLALPLWPMEAAPFIFLSRFLFSALSPQSPKQIFQGSVFRVEMFISYWRCCRFRDRKTQRNTYSMYPEGRMCKKTKIRPAVTYASQSLLPLPEHSQNKPQVVECLPSKFEALSSSPSTTKTNKAKSKW